MGPGEHDQHERSEEISKMQTDHTLQAKPSILDFMIKINEMEAMEEFKDGGRDIIAPYCDMREAPSQG